MPNNGDGSAKKNVDGIFESTKPATETKIDKKKWLIPAIVVVVVLIAVVSFAGYRIYKAKNVASKVVDPTEQAAVKEEGQKVATTVAYVSSEEGLRLRSESTTEATTLATMPYGSKLTILEVSTNWYKVTYTDKTGWCMKEFTSLEKPKEFSIRDVNFAKVINLKTDVNSLAPTQYADYNGDGREEALVTVLYEGTGVYRDFYIYGYRDGLTLTKYLDLRPTTFASAFVAGFQGHDTLDFAAKRLVLSYPIYKKDDPNCCPTGGKEYVYFKWDGKKFIIDKKVAG